MLSRTPVCFDWFEGFPLRFRRFEEGEQPGYDRDATIEPEGRGFADAMDQGQECQGERQISGLRSPCVALVATNSMCFFWAVNISHTALNVEAALTTLDASKAYVGRTPVYGMTVHCVSVLSSIYRLLRSMSKTAQRVTIEENILSASVSTTLIIAARARVRPFFQAESAVDVAPIRRDRDSTLTMRAKHPSAA